MATPFGSDWHAPTGGNGQHDSSGDDHLYSWLPADEKPGAGRVSTDTTFSSLLEGSTDPSTVLRQKMLGDSLHTQQMRLRSRVALGGNDDGARETSAENKADNVPNVTLVGDRPAVATAATVEKVQPQTYQPTNLEITDNKKEVQRPLIAPQTVEQVRDLGCAQLERLSGPTSASSQWMAQNRPDLLAQFSSDQCGYRWTSSYDGTVSAVLTSPEGYYRSLTAKGTTTSEMIADPEGRVLFRHRSVNNSTSTNDKIA